MGTQAPFPHRDTATPPPILAHICCGKMARLIKMPLGMEVGLNPGDIVLDGDSAPLPKRGQSPLQFSAHVYCGQTATWIKMPLGWWRGVVVSVVRRMNEVTLPWALLVLGWVTVFGRV